MEIHDEDERQFNPNNRSASENAAYLKGMSDSAARKAKTSK